MAIDTITSEQVKIISGIIAALSIIFKLRENLLIPLRKKNLKLNIEIFQSLKLEPSFNSENIKESIEKEIKKIYKSKDDANNISNVILGTYLVILFGWWSYDIYVNKGFSGWLFLTGFIFSIGISLIFEDPQKQKDKVKISSKFHYKFGIYNVSRLWFAFVILVISCYIIYWSYDVYGFSFWIFLLLAFILSSIFAIINNFKRIDE